MATTNTYDAVDRLTGVSFTGYSGEAESYTYDDTTSGNVGIGRLTSWSDESGSGSRVYDNFGNVTSETRVIGGKTYTISYSYDLANRVTEVIYPSGRYADYTYDSSGYLTTVTTKPSSGGSVTTLASSITHKPFGPITGLIYGNSEALTRTFDNNYWPTAINTIYSGTYVQELSYGQDDAGNLTSITDTLDSTRNESFGVDGLNRLHTASGKYGSYTYTYDNNSNRATSYDGTTTLTTTNVSSENLPDHITDGTNTRHFTWTANGNMATDDRTFVGGGAAAMTYGGRNLLESMTVNSQGITYKLNAFAQRVSEAFSGSTTHYIYNTKGEVIAEADGSTGTTTMEYVWLEGELLAQIDGSGNIVYVHNNQVHAPQKITNSSRTLVWDQIIKPFGEVYSTPTSTTPTSWRFPGQYANANNSLSHNSNRDYDPSCACYVESDPTGLAGGLVKLHGGAIAADSHPDYGTKFTVSVPFGAAHLPESRVGIERGPASTSIRAETFVQEALRWLPDGKPVAGVAQTTDVEDGLGAIDEPARILLADDNADMRAYVSRLLEPQCEVQTVADGESALAAIRARRPDLVITDAMMPRLDGLGLLRTIRGDARLRDLPVMMLSARAGEENRVEGLKAGADDYLTKPFSARELIGRVSAMLQISRMRRENAKVLQQSNERLRQSEAWLAGQNEAFQAAMNGAPLTSSLKVLIDTALKLAGDERRCAFYIANAERTALRHVAGMSEAYARAVDGFKIGADSLGCGLAAHTGRPVITRDVMEDPRWAPWRQVAREHDYRACWSFPVETSAGKVVGTFAMYLREPGKPTPRDLELAAALTRTASIIISRHQEAEERARVQLSIAGQERALAAELAITESLHALSTELIPEQDDKVLYQKLVDAAAAIMRSDFASLQMYYPERGKSGELRLLAFRGFDPDAVRFWEWVRADSGCTCGQVLRTGRRAIAADVETCDFMAGTPDRAAYLQAGMRAAQSTPLLSRSGRLLGMISTHWREPHTPLESDLRHFDVLARQAADLLERAESELKLHRSEEQLRLALEAADVGLWDVDPINDRLFWPPRVKAMFGISPDVPVSMADFYAGLHPDDRERTGTAYAEAADPAKRALYDVEYRTIGKEDGIVRWVAAKGRGVFDASGACIRVIGTAIDITARKRHEERLKLLVDELNHRVKNTLATVQSIAGQTLRNAPTKADGRLALESRLMALASAHDLLTRGHWESASLREVVMGAMSAYGADSAESKVRVDGPDIQLLPKSALALAMALHELATNAVKYGALSDGGGRVNVTWKVTAAAPERFDFHWAESGGPPVTKPRSRGFGSRLIERGLAQDLAARIHLDFAPAGVVCTIDAPIEEIRARGDRLV